MELRIFCTLCFIIGILFPDLSWTSRILVLGTLCILALWREALRTPAALCLIILSLGAGLARSHWDLISNASVKQFGRVKIEGTILEPPRRWGNSSVFFLEVEVLNDETVRQPFKVLCRWSQCEQNLEPGDRWGLSGKLGPAPQAEYPGGYDQQKWLWSQNGAALLSIHKFSAVHFLSPPTGHSPHQLAYRCRAWMMKRLECIKEPSERALIAGVVFGETQSLPKELQDQFRRTGTSHLLAASGMNVALLAGLILGLGAWLGYGPWRVAPLALPAVIGYAFLAGCGPSITRAATGTSLSLLAISLGRTSSPWNSLALSVWALLFWDPRQVHDLGFQLSAVAVIGLVGGAKAPQKWNWMAKSLLLTFSASLVTLPFFWYAFGELSSTLLIANLALGPIVELLFPLGLLLALLPIKPLVFASSLIAKLSLFLVKIFSQLADPIYLSKPSLPVFTIVLTAIFCWLSPWSLGKRCLAIPLVISALSLACYQAKLPPCDSQSLLIRRVGSKKPVYWISSQSEELLVLTEAWQEKRARSMIRDLGCLREVQMICLKEGEPFQFEHKGFSWQNVQPLLPAASFLKLEIKGESYRMETWDPPNSQSQSAQDL